MRYEFFKERTASLTHSVCREPKISVRGRNLLRKENYSTLAYRLTRRVWRSVREIRSLADFHWIEHFNQSETDWPMLKILQKNVVITTIKSSISNQTHRFWKNTNSQPDVQRRHNKLHLKSKCFVNSAFSYSESFGEIIRITSYTLSSSLQRGLALIEREFALQI